MGETRTAYTNLIGKSEGKRALGRFMRGWEENIEMELEGIDCEGVEWI
jgi:hypothetical protein